jgi:uncharacterized lipoprotein YmbA
MEKWLLMLALLLAGCAGEQATEVRHYLLPDTPGEIQLPSSSPLLVVTTDLAEYLKSNSLLYRSSETQVVYAKHNLWAEDLEQQLTRRIVNDLYRKQSVYRPVVANPAIALDGKPQLYIHLQKFNGAYTGVAEIAGEWQLLDREGQIVRNDTFLIEVPLKEQGYSALIGALSEGVALLTVRLAGKI